MMQTALLTVLLAMQARATEPICPGGSTPRSGNDYSALPALSGFSSYGASDNNWSKYVALSVVGGQWAIVQRPDGATPQLVARAGSVTFDSWHEFELMIHQDNSISLMVDKARLIKTALPSSAAWLWDYGPASFTKNIVIGVIDFNGSASSSAPFNVYYDDTDAGTASFWSCDGWDASSCPFGAPGDRTAPAAPRRLALK